MQKIILVPRAGKPEKVAGVFGVCIAAMALVTSCLLAAAYMGAIRRGLDFVIPGDFWGIVLLMTLFMLVLIGAVSIISASAEFVWVHDPSKGEIRLEDHYFGHAVFTRRYSIQDVAGIRIWWQQSYSGRKPVVDTPGWWMAALVFWSGKSIHLHGVRCGPEQIPVDWLNRFEQACRISGMMLKSEPVEPTAKTQPPVTSMINKLKGG